MISSLLALVRRVYRPRIAVLGWVGAETSEDEDYRFRSIDRHPEYTTVPGLVIFRFLGELSFANASFFRDETLRLVAESPPPAQVVLVDASAISHLDTTAAAMLEDLLARLEAEGVRMELARVRTSFDDALRRTGLRQRFEPDRIHASVRIGVAAFERREGDRFR